jgi:cytochrome c556
MSRAWRGAVILAAVAAGLAGVLSVYSAEREKGSPIKAVMKQVFNYNNKKSLLATLGADLKAEEPDWAKVQKESKEVVQKVAPLHKATPPRGERESWDKLTAAALLNARNLEAAAESKNKDKAVVSYKALHDSCRSCHTAHRILKKKG